MQIINKNNSLISKLNGLKPELSDDFSRNDHKFTKLLKSNLETNLTSADIAAKNKSSFVQEIEDGTPSWVDPEYGYDPENPRKPNMRELMQAISGKNVEDLYSESKSNWQKISHTTSEMLYGVVGENKDTRDWPSIMSSNDILTKAREQTGAMYEPEVDIQSNFDDAGILTEQIAVIKDNKGNILRSLSNDITSAEETLINFGASKKSIPINIEQKIDSEVFDNDLLAFLQNFDNSPTSIQQVVVQSASEVIANKLSQEIPLDELAKL